MTGRRWALGAGLLLPALALVGRPSGPVYDDRPPPAHTGGFGEPTCAACHFDQPTDDATGNFAIGGLPERYRPGERYTLTITLTRSGMAKGGFQLAARSSEGEAVGRQAGELRSLDGRVGTTVEAGIQYVHHTKAGTAPVVADTARWRVEWLAPAAGGGAVVLHLAGNAAGGDDSQFGDFVYTRVARSEPQ